MPGMELGQDSEQREFELSLEDELDCRAENREEWVMLREGYVQI